MRGAGAGPAVQHSKNGDQLRSHARLIKQPEGKCNRRHGRVETRAHNVPFYDAFGRSAGRTDAGATWKSADSVSARPHLRLDENERLERLVRAGDAPARRGPTISLVSEPISSNFLKKQGFIGSRGRASPLHRRDIDGCRIIVGAVGMYKEIHQLRFYTTKYC